MNYSPISAGQQQQQKQEGGRSDWQLYLRENRDNLLSWALLFLAIYFTSYLFFREPADSLIHPYIIVAALLVCVATIFYLQYRHYFYRQSSSWTPSPPERRLYQFLNEARIEHLHNNLRRDIETMQEQKVEPYATPQFTKFSTSPLVGSLYRPEEGTTEKRQRLGYEGPSVSPIGGGPIAESTRLPLGLGLGGDKRWERPSDAKKSLVYQYQGDLMDYETQSSNTLALELYEKMGIKRKVPVWAENVRSWMAGTFIPMILTNHYENLEQLNKVLAYYSRRVIFNRYEDVPMSGGVRPILWEELYESVVNNKLSSSLLYSFQPIDPMYRSVMNEGQLSASLKELVRNRMSIEKYLRTKENSLAKRDYVTERLRQLQSNFVGEYQNNGGGYWRGEPWSPALPRDSDIVSWIFFRMLMQLSFGQSDDRVEVTRQFVSTFPDYPRMEE